MSDGRTAVPAGAVGEHWVNPEPFDPGAQDAPLTPEQERYFQAGQWELIWRRFHRHKLAVVSLWFLAFLYACLLIVELIAPYSKDTRNPSFIHAPPQQVHLFHEGRLVGPFVYGFSYKLDMANLRAGKT